MAELRKILSFRKNIPFRRELRKTPTKAEKILWPHLRAERLGGLKIRRQHGIGNYIVDFFHADSKTIIELDGDVHFALRSQEQKDIVRENWLKSQGYKILRFNNVDIFNNLSGVLEHLYHNLTNGGKTSPSPSP